MTQTEAPDWAVTKVTIATTEGPREIEAIEHPNAPGLVVTMHQFGLFAVTHRSTGTTVVRHFERCGGAMLAAAHLSRCADFTKDAEGIKQHLAEHGDESCGVEGCTITSKGETRPMTKRELFDSVRRWMLLDEFPWESPDESPSSKAMEILESAPDYLRAEVPSNV